MIDENEIDKTLLLKHFYENLSKFSDTIIETFNNTLTRAGFSEELKHALMLRMLLISVAKAMLSAKKEDASDDEYLNYAFDILKHYYSFYK